MFKKVTVTIKDADFDKLKSYSKDLNLSEEKLARNLILIGLDDFVVIAKYFNNILKLGSKT
jgi:hypothetical protein